MTEEEIFKQKKKLFAAQLKQDLMYGGSKKQQVMPTPTYDDYEDEEAVEEYDGEDLSY